MTLYTDAAKEGENVGYGWIASIENYEIAHNISSAKDISVYKAEMLAIREALSWLKDNLVSERKNIIYTDSQGAVMALESRMAKDSISKDILTLLKELNKIVTTEIKWIKGHNENTGNEMADYLAKEGARRARKLHDTKPHMPITQREVKQKVHSSFIKQWQHNWDATTSYRISKLFYPLVRESKSMVRMKIKDLQVVAQVATGHGLFKEHISHWENIENGQCAICGEADENSWHLWEWCPGLDIERKPIQTLIKSGMTMERGIIKLMNTRKVKELIAQNESLLTRQA